MQQFKQKFAGQSEEQKQKKFAQHIKKLESNIQLYDKKAREA